jgi:hypothetical protein
MCEDKESGGRRRSDTETREGEIVLRSMHVQYEKNPRNSFHFSCDEMSGLCES